MSPTLSSRITPLQALARWWQEWLAHPAVPTQSGVAVALSGGPDSVALAASLAPLARAAGVPLQCWHVHHGLSADADAWQHSCQQLAARLEVPLRVRRVVLTDAARQTLGLEGAARQARYEALHQLATAHGVRHLVLAHHADDQAETVLIRLLRGAGPGALAGMQPCTVQRSLTLWRPWLPVPREPIRALARQAADRHGLALAHDTSNIDPRHARGQLRQAVLPAIAAHWPGYRDVLLRHAHQAAEVEAVLTEVAASDLAPLLAQEGLALRLPQWLALSPARASLVMRAWLARLGAPRPGAARLGELERQLRTARSDRQIRWHHDGWELTRHREHILARRVPSPPAKVAAFDGTGPTVDSARQSSPDAAPLRRVWQGESSWILPHGRGVLCFDQVAEGWDPQWLRGRTLELGWDLSGGRLRLRRGGPARSLKRCFQEAGVPAWERPQCLRVRADGQLVYVHALGGSVDVPHARPGLRLRWQPTP